MVNLAEAFHKFRSIRALVVGDFMVDKYTLGTVKRISPEAPVSVLKVEKEETRAGGAGNVALNLHSLGSKVFVLGRVGNDANGALLKDTLGCVCTNTLGLYTEESYQTPVKNRFIADAQQVLRVDYEESNRINVTLEEKIIEELPAILKEINVVAVSDYNKGFLSTKVLSSLIELCRKSNIPVVVDPKGLDFSKYRGATLIKPNLSEAYLASSLDEKNSLDMIASVLQEKTCVDWLLITRSKDGISLFERDGSRSDFPVRSHEVKDVTGAGDTVLAIMAICIANHIDIAAAIHLANIAAGLSIERLGCASITISDFARRLLEKDCDMKVFEESHLSALQSVLQDHPFSILGIDSTQGITTEFFRVLKQLSKSEKELILYIKDSAPDQEFIQLLSSIHEVDYLILQRRSLESLCAKMKPSNVFELQGNQLVELEQAMALFA